MSKYKKISGYTGIRKNLSSGTYEASKKINGKTFSKTFKSIREAHHWRNTFNPFQSNNHFQIKMTFSQLWERYEECKLPVLAKSTQGIKKQKIAVLKDELNNLDIEKITPCFLDYLIQKKKSQYKNRMNSKRCNFDKALSELKTILNWYKENYEPQYHNPVLKRHYIQGVIKKPVIKEKVLQREQLVQFLQGIDSPLYQDFAIVQFFCASRFGEIAGIQLKNIDLQMNSLLIKEVVVEDQSKNFLELKDVPKNGHPRVVAITSEIFRNAILRRLNNIKTDSNYLFHINGLPLSYRSVQYRYNKALKQIGLFPQYSSTHFLRYSMATESRRVMGSLDAAQAITGHHSIKMVEHYAKLPNKLQAKTVESVGKEISISWDKLTM